MAARPVDQSAEIDFLNAELESFRYSVSHDLRTPVRAVIGFARALEEDYAPSLDADGRRLLSIVANEADRINGLIDDLLALSHLGRQPLEPVSVDMTSLARDVAFELLKAGAAENVSLDIADLPAAYGDRAMLRSVWRHLISNAMKFSSQRDVPRLDIYASKEAGRIVFHVRDNGIGLDMAYAGKLFGVFQKLNASEAFTGSGVGLAMVKRIMQRHGGAVQIDGRLDEGATVSFGIPTETNDGRF